MFPRRSGPSKVGLSNTYDMGPLHAANSDGTWHWRTICPSCGWHTAAAGEMVFAVTGPFAVAHRDHCLNCGAIVSNTWNKRFMRWESCSIWWRPSTWGSGRWKAMTQ